MVGHEYEALTGRVSRIRSSNIGGLFQDVEHTYDANGNLETRTDNVAPPGTAFDIFLYDGRNRLVDHYHGGTLVEHVDYTPDGSGNIQNLSSLGNYAYNPVPNRPAHMPSTAGNVTLTFDPRGTGNVVTRATSSSLQNFTYDAAAQVTGIGVNGVPNAVQLKYHTNGDRASKATAAGIRIRYSGAYERETTATTTEHRYRIDTPFGPIGEIVRNDAGAELSRTLWHKDLLGSPEVITTAGGGVVHRQRFSAFGRSDNPSWESANPAIRRVRRGYTGHEHDPETGLVNMRARLYDPVIARFLTPDPIVQRPGWTQSWNRFSYAWNSPMNWVDPLGLQNVEVSMGDYCNAAGQCGAIPGIDIALQGDPMMSVYLPQLAYSPYDPLTLDTPLGFPSESGQDTGVPFEVPGANPTDEFSPRKAESLPIPLGIPIPVAPAPPPAPAPAPAPGPAARPTPVPVSPWFGAGFLATQDYDPNMTGAPPAPSTTPAPAPAPAPGGSGGVGNVPPSNRTGTDTPDPDPNTPRWPQTPEEMDKFLRMTGNRIPDGPTTPGRGMVRWQLGRIRITFEKHPYDVTSHPFHRGPHWHLDSPGWGPHSRFLPGDPIPGFPGSGYIPP
jgi:RHS repeat-associated protein